MKQPQSPRQVLRLHRWSDPSACGGLESNASQGGRLQRCALCLKKTWSIQGYSVFWEELDQALGIFAEVSDPLNMYLWKMATTREFVYSQVMQL